MNQTSKTSKLVGTAILMAIVVVLQSVASSIRIGPFTITLALVPIMIGAIIYGPISGASLGAAFGAVVCYAVITGADIGGNLMLQQNAIITILVCILKSTVAGYVAGIVAGAFAKCGKLTLGTVLAAVLCPLINTGILCVTMLAVFGELVATWAQGAGFSSNISYIILSMVGVNFLVELLINIVFVPTITHIIKAVKKA